MAGVEETISALLSESRVFAPPPGFASRALVADPAIYERAEADPEAFWAEQASRLEWFTPWTSVMDWTPPWVKWFQGGTLNVSYNCLDRHVAAGGGDKRVGVRTDGLRYPLAGEPLRAGPARGLSNELVARHASVTTERGRLIVIQTARGAATPEVPS